MSRIQSALIIPLKAAWRAPASKVLRSGSIDTCCWQTAPAVHVALLAASLVLLPVTAHSQATAARDNLGWLNANTTNTVEQYPFVIDRSHFFDEEGFGWAEAGRGSWIVRWRDITGVRLSHTDKIIVYSTGRDGETEVQNHITPKAHPEAVLRAIGRLAQEQGAEVKYYTNRWMTPDELYHEGDRMRERADSLRAAKHFEAAAEIYRQLVNPSAHAFRRHRQYAQEQLDLLPGLQRVEDAASISRGIGAGIGVNYGASYFTDDGGLFGISLARGFGDEMLGFVDVKVPGALFGGASDDDVDGMTDVVGERTQVAIAVGATVPFVTVGPVGIHMGYSWQQTTMRGLHLGLVGLNIAEASKDLLVRVDATFVDGKPRYGFAVSANFGK